MMNVWFIPMADTDFQFVQTYLIHSNFNSILEMQNLNKILEVCFFKKICTMLRKKYVYNN